MQNAIYFGMLNQGLLSSVLLCFGTFICSISRADPRSLRSWIWEFSPEKGICVDMHMWLNFSEAEQSGYLEPAMPEASLLIRHV